MRFNKDIFEKSSGWRNYVLKQVISLLFLIWAILVALDIVAPPSRQLVAVIALLGISVAYEVSAELFKTAELLKKICTVFAERLKIKV